MNLCATDLAYNSLHGNNSRRMHHCKVQLQLDGLLSRERVQAVPSIDKTCPHKYKGGRETQFKAYAVIHMQRSR